MVSMKEDKERMVVRKVCVRLADERKRRGISQQRLSEMAGLSRTGVRHVESLETNPTLSSLLKIANALELDLAAIISES
jgi:transcriptional regulator with XRE-family HTH domain